MYILIWEVLLGISILKNYNPEFEVELESAGSISSDLRTEFTSIGINQTHHKIYLHVETKIGILTPFDTFGKEVNTDVLLTESIIVGEVPDVYYNLEDKDKLLETYNFTN